MEKLLFEFPTLKRKEEAIDFIQEFLDHDSAINGTGGLDTNNYEAWLIKTRNAHEGVNVPADRVPATTFFLVRESDDRIIGMVNLRHILSEFLIKHGYGHIGYSIRPTERRKGYATKLLEMTLEECKKLNIKDVHVGCYKDNRGSYRTIEKNGGQLLREFQEEDGTWNLEYVIKL